MYHVINNVMIGLNRVGGVFYDYAAGVFIQSALLVILLFVIDLLLRKRVRAIFRYCVWLLVLVKLILPPMLSLPTGIGYWAGDHIPTAPGVSNMALDAVALEHAGTSGEMPQVRPAENIAGHDPAMTLAESALTALTWKAVVFLLWLAGVLAFLAVLIQRIRFVKGLVAASCPAGDELTGLLEQCRRQMTVHRDIKLRLSEAVPSPAVCGLLRPTVLMPTSLVEKLSPEGLRATLIHELAHIKRGDLWVNSVQTFLQVVYFYNPFVWFANSIIRKVCEEAVDETVLVALGSQAKDYSNTLIDIGETVFWRADLGLRLIGVAESKKALQRRIRHMLNRPIPKSSKLGVLGIIVIFTIAAVLLPMAKAEKSTKAEKVEKPPIEQNEGKPTKSLHEAAVDGDLKQVKLNLSQGTNVNAKDRRGRTALHRAAYEGHADVVRLLIDRGADVNARDKSQRTPLHSAAMNGDRKTIEMLLSKDADISAKNKQGGTPLFVAMTSTEAVRKEVVELLVAKGAKIPALHLAAYMGNIEKLKKCLQDGIDIDSQEDFGSTALHLAANSGKKDIVEFLIIKGAKVDAKDVFDWTPLLYAASHNYEDIADLLIAKGADVNAKDNRDYTLLYHAIWDIERSKNATKLIIGKGANVNVQDESGFTPLVWAIWMDDKEIVELLIENGADVNAKDKDGYTPMHWAAMKDSKDIVELLTAKGAAAASNIHFAAATGDLEKVKAFIEKGTDVNTKDKAGLTALQWAIPQNHKDVAAFLIDKGAAINVRDKRGQTPFHQACLRGRKDMAEFLISKGADVNTKANTWHTTPLIAAIRNGHEDIAKLLIAEGVDINARGRGDYTALHWTAVNRSRMARAADLMELLLAKGADIEARQEHGATPLACATYDGNTESAKFLIEHGADIEAKLNDGETTPLLRAVREEHVETARLLLAKGANKNATWRGLTPVHLAMIGDRLSNRRSDKEMVTLLIEYGLEFTEINLAAFVGDLQKIKDCIARGTSTDHKDAVAFTPLHCAVCGDHMDVVKFLLSKEANVNAKSIKNWTPLGFTWTAEMAALLIANGADVKVADDRGQTALHWAVNRDNHRGDKQLVELLLKHGADPDAKAGNTSGSWAGWTPLHVACRNGARTMVELLLAHSGDVNSKADKGETPLSLALARNHRAVVELLKKHGAKE